MHGLCSSRPPSSFASSKIRYRLQRCAVIEAPYFVVVVVCWHAGRLLRRKGRAHTHSGTNAKKKKKSHSGGIFVRLVVKLPVLLDFEGRGWIDREASYPRRQLDDLDRCQ